MHNICRDKKKSITEWIYICSHQQIWSKYYVYNITFICYLCVSFSQWEPVAPCCDRWHPSAHVSLHQVEQMRLMWTGTSSTITGPLTSRWIQLIKLGFALSRMNVTTVKQINNLFCSSMQNKCSEILSDVSACEAPPLGLNDELEKIIMHESF